MKNIGMWILMIVMTVLVTVTSYISVTGESKVVSKNEKIANLYCSSRGGVFKINTILGPWQVVCYNGDKAHLLEALRGTYDNRIQEDRRLDCGSEARRGLQAM